MKKLKRAFVLAVFLLSALLVSFGCNPGGQDPGQNNPGGQDPAYYTVSFDSQGGSAVAQIQNVKEAEMIAEPDPPVYEGKRFGGWYQEAACENQWNFDTDSVTGDFTLFAKWISPDIVSAKPIDKITDRINNVGAEIVRPFWEPDSANSWEAAPNSGGAAFKPEVQSDGSLFFTSNMQANFQLFRIVTEPDTSRYDNLGATFHDHNPSADIFNKDYQYTFMLKSTTDFQIVLFATVTTNLTTTSPSTDAGSWVRLAHDANGLNMQTARGNVNGQPAGVIAPTPLARASDSKTGYIKGQWNRVDMVFSRDKGPYVNGKLTIGYMTLKLYINGYRVNFSPVSSLAAHKNLNLNLSSTAPWPGSMTVDAAALDADGNFVWCTGTPAAQGHTFTDSGYGQRFIVQTDATMSLSLKKFENG